MYVDVAVVISMSQRILDDMLCVCVYVQIFPLRKRTLQVRLGEHKQAVKCGDPKNGIAAMPMSRTAQLTGMVPG